MKNKLIIAALLGTTLLAAPAFAQPDDSWRQQHGNTPAHEWVGHEEHHDDAMMKHEHHGKHHHDMKHEHHGKHHHKHHEHKDGDKMDKGAAH
jgi:hypothetical protein